LIILVVSSWSSIAGVKQKKKKKNQIDIADVHFEIAGGTGRMLGINFFPCSRV